VICDSPKTINYDSRSDEDVTILTTNNKLNEEAVNSLKGSTKKWSPNDQGSGITYVINGQNNTAQFVDGTLTTINVEYVIIDLLDTRGRVISSEKVSIYFMGICIGDLSQFWLSCSGPFVLLLFKLYIIWFSNLSILRVPNEGYSGNASCALNLISTFLLLYQSWLKCIEYVKGNHKECPNSFI